MDTIPYVMTVFYLVLILVAIVVLGKYVLPWFQVASAGKSAGSLKILQRISLSGHHQGLVLRWEGRDYLVISTPQGAICVDSRDLDPTKNQEDL